MDKFELNPKLLSDMQRELHHEQVYSEHWKAFEEANKLYGQFYSDLLWSVMALAKRYDFDPGQAIEKASE